MTKHRSERLNKPNCKPTSWDLPFAISQIAAAQLAFLAEFLNHDCQTRHGAKA